MLKANCLLDRFFKFPKVVRDGDLNQLEEGHEVLKTVLCKSQTHLVELDAELLAVKQQMEVCEG